MQRGRGGRDKGSGNSVQREFDNDSVYRINSSVDSTVKSSRFPSTKRHAVVEKYHLTVCIVVNYLDQWHRIHFCSLFLTLQFKVLCFVHR